MENLNARIENDDDAARSELIEAYKEHHYALCRYAGMIVGDKHNAQDIVQTAFLQLFENLNGYKLGTNMRSLLYKIVRDLCVNAGRRRVRDRNARVLNAHENLTSGDPFPQPDTGVMQFSDEVASAIDDLRPERREVLILVDIRDQTYREVADTLKVLKGTVMSRLDRGRKELRKSLRSYAVKEGILRDVA